MVLMMVFTMMAGLFAEEKTWNMEDTISDENFIGTDEDGTSYYADEDGNIAAVFSDGTVTTENANDDAPDPDNYDGVVETLNTGTSREYTFDDNGNLVDSDTGEQVDTSDWNDVIGVATEQVGKTTPVAGYTYTGTDKRRRITGEAESRECKTW